MHMVHDALSPSADQITFPDFLKVDVRVGTVRDCLPFPEARQPSYILMIDFGPVMGVRKSVAQITVHYTPEALVGRQVMAVVNFPARQIGRVQSEVLVLGFADHEGAIVLAVPGAGVPDGVRLA